MFVQDDGRLPPFSIDEADFHRKVSSVFLNPGNVLTFLRKLKSNGSGGVDNLPNILLKKIASEISFPLSCSFNATMSSSSIPSDWAMGIVVSVFKKGSTSNVNNYRPTSLTCILCKIMESVIKGTMRCHLLKHKLITKHQHSFFCPDIPPLPSCFNVWAIGL